ncbi:MAG TPA: adenylate/guanylate cyclase domain-containing protein, partial [Myxococcota bacterium]|nr:adenylate/guanylate cyclase domain-containing protein [Myxococcota bacterium]
EDVAQRGWLARLWPWAFALAGVGAPSWAFGAPLSAEVGFALTVGGSVAALAAVAAILALQWRRTGPIGRRQLQWVVLGALVAFAPPVLAGIAALAWPAWWWLYELSVTTVVLLPIAILIALVRDHLFDVDRLLTAAAGYTAVCVLLLGCTIVLVPLASSGLEAVIDPQVSEPTLALASAFLLLTARSRLEPWVERRLFPERMRFERGARALRGDLSRCEKPAELFVVLAERLDALLAPESLIVFGRAEEAFAPVYERGTAVVPALALEGPLACELELAGRVLDVGSLAARGADGPLLDLECGALEAMGTVVLAPVLTDRLEAFVCLGAKRSGRGYGASELSLLQSVADKAADELRRFDLEEVQRDQRALCERLRRYVPGVLAERLAAGREAPVGEREVTVLFVDIRGYVGLAERRDPRALFGFVGRYAQSMSEILERHGGAIIDVQGDGLMAVFGAPDRQEQKERLALTAAYELLAAVRDLRIDLDDRSAPDGSAAVDVGIGIASGPAFLGNLATADRAIWSVVGDTVNLAARYQALTREVAAALVLDAATHAAAGAPAELLPLPATAIRGRRGRVDLYRLPAGRAPADPEAA